MAWGMHFQGTGGCGEGADNRAGGDGTAVDTSIHNEVFWLVALEL